MVAKLEFEPIDPNSSYWFRDVTERADQIKTFVSGHGPAFYRLTVFDGSEYHIDRILATKDAALFFLIGSFSEYIGIRKVKSLVKDEQAESAYYSLASEQERDVFLKKWYLKGTRWRPHL